MLRRANDDDVAALAALKRQTFRETFIEGFAIPYPPADLALFEEAAYGPAAVAGELADPELATWVVEEAGQLIGYAKVGPCKLPHAEVQPGAGELYQLYVARSAQGQGHGRALLDIALAHLAETRPGPVWLGVWEGNHPAQAVYAARGFREVGRYLFPVGAWNDRELIYRRDRDVEEQALRAVSL